MWKNKFEGEKWLPQVSLQMSGGQYTQSSLAGGSINMVGMPIGVY